MKRLEYRGYDSAGEATIYEGKLYVKKDHGKIDEVHMLCDLDSLPSKIGLGHIRWATHGAPMQVNAHPHVDCENQVAVVQNGIIENYAEIKRELENLGHVFKSKTACMHYSNLAMTRSMPMPIIAADKIKNIPDMEMLAMLVYVV